MGRPVLFMKSGVTEAEPLHFYNDLADAYNAALISPDTINLEINGGVYSSDKTFREAADEEARRRAKVALLAGANVVYDGFLNGKRRRQEMRDETILPAGADEALLVIHAPLKLIKQRMVERHAIDELTIPASQIQDLSKMLQTAYSTMNDVGWPTDDENPIRLDGQLTTNQLLSIIAYRLDEGPEAA